MKKFYTLISLFCIFSSLSYAPHKEPKAAELPTAPDLGYMFHDGTNTRPHGHITQTQAQEIIASTLPADTILTAETDDISPDSSKESRIAIMLYDPIAKGWFVDYAIISPQSSGRLSSLDEAQIFTLDFLKLPSAKRKAQQHDQAIKQEAGRKEEKRKRLAQSKYKLPTDRR